MGPFAGAMARAILCVGVPSSRGDRRADMTWKRNVLVVANVTATSDELLSTLQERAASQPMSFELIIPATPFAGGSEAASEQLQEALEKLADAGLEAQGSIAHGGDPMVAVTDAWDPK